MKKLFVPVVCVLVGCAAGAAMPAITAQSYGPPAPGAQRWENYCAFDVRSPLNENSKALWNASLAEMGEQGWEYVGPISAMTGTAIPCFRRPAQ